jgi:hypothetical protein
MYDFSIVWGVSEWLVTVHSWDLIVATFHNVVVLHVGGWDR